MISALVLMATMTTVPVRQQQVIIQQQPSVQFLVGGDIRYYTLEQKLRQLIREELARGGEAGDEPVPQTAVGLVCSKCHGGDSPKAGLAIAPDGPLDAATITSALRQLASGKMPKGKNIGREVRNQIMLELLSRELQEVEVPPSPQEETE